MMGQVPIKIWTDLELQRGKALVLSKTLVIISIWVMAHV